MSAPVFELHIRPLFRATDREHMCFNRDPCHLDLWDYDTVKRRADDILDNLEAQSMPPPESGGPWPDEWIQLFRRWKDTGFKRLELGTAQYTFNQTATTMVIQATGTFPTAGYRAWLQIEAETDTSKTYVLYFWPPDASEAGSPEDFTVRERYRAAHAAQSVFIHDATGVQQIHSPVDHPG
jgi:hypothetical protein